MLRGSDLHDTDSAQQTITADTESTVDYEYLLVDYLSDV